MVEGVSRSGQGRTLTAKTTGSFATPCCTCSSPTLRSFPLSFAALVSCLQRFFIREPVRKHFLPAQFPYAAHILSDGGGNARDCKDCNTARSPHAQAGLRRQKTQTSLITCACSRSKRQRHGINHLTRMSWRTSIRSMETSVRRDRYRDFKNKHG